MRLPDKELERQPEPERLLDLELELGREEFVRAVESQVGKWPLAVQAGVSLAVREAGREVAELAGRERAGGFCGRGGPGGGVRRVLRAAARLAGRELPEWRWRRPEVEAEEALARRAERAMLRWEALRRLEDLTTRAARVRLVQGETVAAVEELVAHSGELDARRPGWIAAALAWAKAFAAGTEEAARRLLGRIPALPLDDPLGLGVGRLLLEAELEGVRGGDAAVAGAALARWIAAADEGEEGSFYRVEALLRGAVMDSIRVPLAESAAAFLDVYYRARAARDRLTEARALIGLATVFRRSGPPILSWRTSQLALRRGRRSGDVGAVCTALSDQAFALSVAGRAERALALFGQAIGLARRWRDLNQEAGSLARQASVLLGLGKVLEAQDLCRVSLEIYRRIGARAAQGSMLCNLATVKVQLGEYDAARDLYLEAVRISRDLGRKNSEAITRANLANVYATTFCFAQAQEQFQCALRLSIELGDRMQEASVLHSLATFHLLSGAPERALETYQRTLEISREIGNRQLESRVLTGLANLYAEARFQRRARGLREEALRLARRCDWSAHQAAGLTNLALSHVAEGDSGGARRLFADAIALHRQCGDRYGEAVARCNQAHLELEEGQPAVALPLARAAVRVLAEIGDARREFQARSVLARACWDLGREDAARGEFRRAVAVLEGWVREVGAPPRRTRVLDDALPVFQQAVAALLASGRPRDVRAAFALTERLKARSLLEAVRSRGRDRGVAPELARVRRRVEERLRQLQDALLMEQRQPRARPTLLAHLRRRLDAAKREHEAVLDDLALRFPAHAAEEGLSAPLTLRQVQRWVVGDRSAALIEFLVCPAATYVWVIRRDAVELVELELGEAEVRHAVERVLRPLEHFRRSGDAEELLGLSLPRLRGLYREIMEPLLPHLRGVERLRIVPSGALHRLPFEMLVARLPDEPGWRPPAGTLTPLYLVEQFEVVYGPSATLLDPRLAVGSAGAEASGAEAAGAEAGTEWEPASALVVADPAPDRSPWLRGVGLTASESGGRGLGPLPGAHREADAVRGSLPTLRVEVLAGARATVAAYRDCAPAADLLHLACHSLLDGAAPWYSGILLAAETAGAETGGMGAMRRGAGTLLHSYEIAEIPLPRRPLVVLTACEIAHGSLSSSEGVICLARAFALAGARAVIASRWPLDDRATPRLIEHFYRALSAGAGPAGALAEARRRLLAEVRNRPPDFAPAGDSAVPPALLSPAHPFFWAGFSIFGLAQ